MKRNPCFTVQRIIPPTYRPCSWLRSLAISQKGTKYPRKRKGNLPKEKKERKSAVCIQWTRNPGQITHAAHFSRGCERFPTVTHARVPSFTSLYLCLSHPPKLCQNHNLSISNPQSTIHHQEILRTLDFMAQICVPTNPALLPSIPLDSAYCHALENLGRIGGSDLSCALFLLPLDYTVWFIANFIHLDIELRE